VLAKGERVKRWLFDYIKYDDANCDTNKKEIEMFNTCVCFHFTANK